jgi:hypothetical protein
MSIPGSAINFMALSHDGIGISILDYAATRERAVYESGTCAPALKSWLQHFGGIFLVLEHLVHARPEAP